jgi:hypothetical protein
MRSASSCVFIFVFFAQAEETAWRRRAGPSDSAASLQHGVHD